MLSISTKPRFSASLRQTVMVWLPVPLLLLGMALLWASHSAFVYDAPNLLLVLNFTFSTTSSILVAFLAARSFRYKSDLSLLLLGSGMLIWGVAGVLSIAVSPQDANGQITIFNICALMMASCHVAGVVISFRPVGLKENQNLWLAVAYALALLATLVVAVWFKSGAIPRFFIEGKGGTPVRQIVFGSAMAMLAVTSALLAHRHSRAPTAFLFWYSPGVALLAAGLFGVMIQSAHGNLPSWAGRATQWLGGIYMLIAGLKGARASQSWHLSLESQLQLSREKLELALGAAELGTWIYNFDNDELDLGPRAQVLYNVASSTIIQDEAGARRLIHPEDFPTMWRAMEQARSPLGDGRYQAEYRVRAASGADRWLSVWGRVEFAGEGPDRRAVRLVGVSRDVTNTKQDAQALRESEERFRAALDYFPSFFALYDSQRRIAYLNKAVTDRDARPLVDLIGKRDEEVWAPEITRLYLPRLLKAFETKETQQFEVTTVVTSEASFTHIVTFVPLLDPAGNVRQVLGITHDITDRKRLEVELERLVARRTAKLQELVGELEHFSYSITHDMRAPLRAMRGFAEIIREKLADTDDPELRVFIRQIITASERMDLLITDALNYNRAVREEPSLAPVDLDHLLRGILDTYPEFIAHRPRIIIAGPLPVVLGNEAGLTQCFSNLINNAVKFVPEDREPEVRIRAEPVFPESDPRGDWVRVWVEDKGVGISANMVPKLFHMFQRGSNSHEGNGIGLALVRKVVERMGGKVGVMSELGQGSRFWIEIPRCHPPGQPLNAPPVVRM